jgi:two-component sensor histidine kinase
VKLRARLLMLALGAMLPTLGVIVINEAALRRSRVAEVNDLALRNAREAVSELDRVREGVLGILLAIGEMPSVRNLQREECSAYLRTLQEQIAQLTAITVVDLNGELRCRHDVPEQPVNYSDRSWFKQVLETRAPAVGEYSIGKLSKAGVLPIAAPLKSADGTMVGVMVAGVDLGWLSTRLRERGVAAGAALTIADRQGVIIAREPFPERFVGMRIPEAYMHLVRSSSVGTLPVVSQDGTRRIMGFVPPRATPLDLYVSSGLSDDESFAAIDRASLVSALLALAGAVLALLVAWWIGEKFITRPVNRVVKVVGAWRKGRTDRRSHLDSRFGELAEVGSALDGLLDEVERRQQERDLLLHELDHRVKNTMAVVQAVVMQTLRREATSADIREALSQRLGNLARAHEVLTQHAWRSGSMEEVLQASLAVHLQSGRVTASGPPVTLPPRAVLALGMVFHELLTNAIKYGALSVPEGRVEIRWEPTGGNRLALTWAENDGPRPAEQRKEGFGSRMIRRSIAGPLDGRAEFSFAPQGLVCTLELSLAEADQQPGFLDAAQ